MIKEDFFGTSARLRVLSCGYKIWKSYHNVIQIRCEKILIFIRAKDTELTIVYGDCRARCAMRTSSQNHSSDPWLVRWRPSASQCHFSVVVVTVRSFAVSAFASTPSGYCFVFGGLRSGFRWPQISLIPQYVKKWQFEILRTPLAHSWCPRGKCHVFQLTTPVNYSSATVFDCHEFFSFHYVRV